MWYVMLFVDWAVIIGTYVAALSWVQLVPALLVSILVVGTRQHALAILAHDASHFVVPNWAGRLCFYALGVDLHRYRTFHFKHHLYVGTPLDPELKLRTPAWDVFSWKYVAKDALGLSTVESVEIWLLAGGNAAKLVSASVVMTGVEVVVRWLIDTTLTPWFWLVWLVAFSTSFMVCFRQRAINDHGAAYDPCMLLKLIMLPHRSWLHQEHHDKPGTPFYKLESVQDTVHS